MLHVNSNLLQMDDSHLSKPRSSPDSLQEFHFNRFVEDESNFRPQDGHRTIELLETVDGSEMRLKDSEISEADICSWLHQVTQPQA
jgi:hypothetical protein